MISRAGQHGCWPRANKIILTAVVAILVFPCVVQTQSCGRNFTFGDTLRSPGFPQNYPANQNCTFTFSSDSSDPYDHRLDFTDFNLTQSANPSCDSDYIKVSRPGANSQVYCGTDTPPDLVNITRLTFVSSEQAGAGYGFQATVNRTIRCADVGVRHKFQTFNHQELNLNFRNDKHLEGACTWNVTVDEGYTILAVVRKANLARSTDCSKEYIKFYDDDTPSHENLLETFCGYVSHVESSSNVMLTEFYTDGTDANPSADIRYFAVNESNECGTTDLKDSKGSIVMITSLWKNGVCVWKITAEEGLNVLLRIQYYITFRINLRKKISLKVYDGDKEDESHLLRDITQFVAYPAETGLMISTTNTLLVVLSVNQDVGYDVVHFSADYTVVNATLVNRRCGGNVTGSRGIITPPNYPNNSDSVATCQWFITVEPALTIQIDSIDNDGHEDDDYYGECTTDYLIVRDGNGTTVFSGCAEYNSKIHIHDNQASVTFTADPEVFPYRSGIRWQRVCGREVNTPSEGILQSPNYPDNYMGDLSCVYDFGRAPGYSTVFSFHNFELEGPSSNGSCTNDYLEVDYRSSSDLTPGMEETQRYCGDNIPSTLTLYPPVLIRFVTDLYNSNSGFNVSYKFVKADCGQLLYTEETGTITSPNYPGTFPSWLNCTYVIRVEPGQTINLTFDHLTLGGSGMSGVQGPDCITSFKFSSWAAFAFLSVFDGEVSENTVSAASNSLINSFCGSRVPTPVSSNSNAVTLFFATASNYALRGFSATYTAISNTSTSVRVAMRAMVQIAAPPDLLNGTTNAAWKKMGQDALYNKLKPDVPGLESVNVSSIRPGSLIIDSVVVVNNETHPYSTSNLTFALMNMVQGQITINNQTGNISLTVGSVTVDASARACDVYNQIARCSSGYQCRMQGGSLSCGQIPKNEDGIQVVFIAAVVAAAVLVIVVVIIIIVCIKRKKTARKTTMPINLADLNKKTEVSGQTG